LIFPLLGFAICVIRITLSGLEKYKVVGIWRSAGRDNFNSNSNLSAGSLESGLAV
jgi:hypothetical protein